MFVFVRDKLRPEMHLRRAAGTRRRADMWVLSINSSGDLVLDLSRKLQSVAALSVKGGPVVHTLKDPDLLLHVVDHLERVPRGSVTVVDLSHNNLVDADAPFLAPFLRALLSHDAVAKRLNDGCVGVLDLSVNRFYGFKATRETVDAALTECAGLAFDFVNVCSNFLAAPERADFFSGSAVTSVLEKLIWIREERLDSAGWHNVATTEDAQVVVRRAHDACYKRFPGLF